MSLSRDAMAAHLTLCGWIPNKHATDSRYGLFHFVHGDFVTEGRFSDADWKLEYKVNLYRETYAPNAYAMWPKCAWCDIPDVQFDALILAIGVDHEP
jgi:hypothetical protein